MTVLDHSRQLSDNDTTTPPEQCPHWCTRQHEPGAAHESFAFDVHAIGQSFFVRIVQAGGSTPRIVAENNPGPAVPFSLEFTLAAAHDFSNVLAELRCIARLCDCWRDVLCPGNPMYVSYEQYREVS